MIPGLRSVVLVLIACLACVRLQAQSIRITVRAGDKELLSDSTEVNTRVNGQITIRTVRFYLSDVRLVRSGAVVWRDSQAAHLIDLRDPGKNVLVLPDGVPYDSLYFRFGTDSLLNVSGALAGDLDPAKGMYWAWNSGYIHCKIEGMSERSNAPRHAIEYHLGGYLPPYASSREVRLPAGTGLVLDLTEFLESIKPAEQSTVNTPGPEAVRLCEVLARSFRMQP